MEENLPKTGKYALNFGILAGGVGIVFGIMLYTMDLHYEQSFAVQGVQMVILIAAIILGVLQFKKANNGFLKLSDALKIGAGVGLITAILGLIYFFILSNVIEPGYMDKVYEVGKVQAMEANPKLTEEQIDQGIEMQKNFSWVAYPIGLIFNTVLGLIVGLVMGLVAKKEKPAY